MLLCTYLEERPRPATAHGNGHKTKIRWGALVGEKGRGERATSQNALSRISDAWSVYIRKLENCENDSGGAERRRILFELEF